MHHFTAYSIQQENFAMPPANFHLHLTVECMQHIIRRLLFACCHSCRQPVLILPGSYLELSYDNRLLLLSLHVPTAMGELNIFSRKVGKNGEKQLSGMAKHSVRLVEIILPNMWNVCTKVSSA